MLTRPPDQICKIQDREARRYGALTAPRAIGAEGTPDELEEKKD